MTLSLRVRLALAATVAVALGIGGVVCAAYLGVRHELVTGVDSELQHQAGEMAKYAGEFTSPGEVREIRDHREFGEPGGYEQFVAAAGRTIRPDGQTPLPVTPQVRAVARGTRGPFYTDLRIQGVHARMLTVPVRGAGAVQVALPLTRVQRELERLGVASLLTGLVGVALAAGLGWLVVRTALAPVVRLTAAAERVAATRDLAHRIEEGRPDELGRLARSFNAMLDALQQATAAQRRLVADASHELRTPLTSLRTNVEVLARNRDLPPGDRDELLRSVVGGFDELTDLVCDIVELARGEEPPDVDEEFRWDAVVRHAVDRARVHWPATTFVTDLAPAVVRGDPARVHRAVANLLDNAAKFGPAGGRVEVRLRDGELRVRDHGPGIRAEDLPHVFDRFYRSAAARGRAGSGLGLAIVKQVAEGHGGTVSADNAPDGGAIMRLRLPVVAIPAETAASGDTAR